MSATPSGGSPYPPSESLWGVERRWRRGATRFWLSTRVDASELEKANDALYASKSWTRLFFRQLLEESFWLYKSFRLIKARQKRRLPPRLAPLSHASYCLRAACNDAAPPLPRAVRVARKSLSSVYGRLRRRKRIPGALKSPTRCAIRIQNLLNVCLTSSNDCA